MECFLRGLGIGAFFKELPHADQLKFAQDHAQLSDDEFVKAFHYLNWRLDVAVRDLQDFTTRNVTKGNA